MKQEKLDASAIALLRALAERQDSLERELSALTSAVKSLEQRLTEKAVEPDFRALEGTADVQAAGEPGEAPGRKHGMKTEVKAVIAAAAAVAGEMVKVRKVRALPSGQDAGSAWSQQGRVGVVSSHQLR